MHNLYAQGVDAPRPRYRPLDWAIEAVALALLVAAFTLPMVYCADLPDQIPRRFDNAGNPTAYGAKGVIFVLPFVATIVYSACTLPLLVPLRMQKYMGPRSPANWQAQARLMRVWITSVKACAVGMITLTVHDSARVAMHGGRATDGVLTTFLLAVFGSMGLWLLASAREAARAKAQLGQDDPAR